MGSPRLRPRLGAAVLALFLLPNLLVPLASQAAPTPAEKRAITETDLFKFVWVTDPRISPDGTRVVFTRVTVNKEKKGYDTALWIVDADGKTPARPFTAGPSDAGPRWSPDGRWISFVRVVPKEGKGDEGAEPQVHLISTAGGEAVALTDLPQGAGGPVWSPDGRRIAFLSGANAKDLAKQKEQEAKKDKKKDDAKPEGEATAHSTGGATSDPDTEHETDIVTITRARYREDGGGYADYTRPAHIWTVDVPTPGSPKPAARQITSGAFDEFNVRWSPDGKLLYFQSERVKEPYYRWGVSSLYSVPSTTGPKEGAKPGEGISLVVELRGDLGDFAVSRDGRSIAAVISLAGEKERSYNESDLVLLDLGAKRAMTGLTLALDGDVSEGISGDQHAPRGGRAATPVFSADGKRVYATFGERGRSNLKSFGLEGPKMQDVTRGDQEVTSFSSTPDAGRFALVLANPTTIGDLYALDPATGTQTPLYRPNEELFSQLKMAPLEEMTYDSFDGRRIQGFVQRPPDFDPARKYPLIVNIHGGPHTAYGFTFFHEMQWMAAKGYVVLYTNPRGSSTFGEEFGNSNQYDFPGKDARDILAGVDVLVKRGFVDPKRMAVTGGSGGGILTNWIVTQDQRFAAAASQRSISDWSAFWGTTDFTLFTHMWFHGAPWEEKEDFARRSPMTYVTRVTTPLLFIEGEADYRTPPGAGGEPMFRALKYLKKPTAMVRFPGEGHELSRSGQPWHRIERLRSIVGWFDKFLKGEKVEQYADLDPE